MTQKKLDKKAARLHRESIWGLSTEKKKKNFAKAASLRGQ